MVFGVLSFGMVFVFVFGFGVYKGGVYILRFMRALFGVAESDTKLAKYDMMLTEYDTMLADVGRLSHLLADYNSIRQIISDIGITYHTYQNTVNFAKF